MATVTYTITNALNGYNTWSGTIEVGSLTDVVSSTIPSSVTAGGGSVSFTPNSFQYYPDASGNGNEYVTWRTYSGPSQYPDSGYSLDIWSTGVFNDINSGGTWNTLIAAGGYSLTGNKYTLLYKYDAPQGPYARYYGQGGVITFT